jgi:bacillithiol system protein YtxJ
MMHWTHLADEDQLKQIIVNSQKKPQVIFKHSTRCSVSNVALKRLEKESIPESVDFYYLDLLAHRNISNSVADTFHVHHESPQILVINNGECVYDESHLGINMADILSNAGN